MSSPRLRGPLNGLFFLFLTELVQRAIGIALPNLVDGQTWWSIDRWLSLGLTCGQVFLIGWLCRVGRQAAPRLAAAFAASIIALVFELHNLAPRGVFAAAALPLAIVTMVAFVAATVLLWLALVELAASAAVPVAAGETTTLVGSSGLRLILWSVQAIALPRLFESIGVTRALVYLRLFSYASLGIFVIITLLFMRLLRRLRAVVAQEELAPPGDAWVGAPSAVISSPSAIGGEPARSRDLLVGALWLGGGLVVTLASYANAASSAGAGRYVVAYGAIGVGVVRILRGLTRA